MTYAEWVVELWERFIQHNRENAAKRIQKCIRAFLQHRRTLKELYDPDSGVFLNLLEHRFKKRFDKFNQ